MNHETLEKFRVAFEQQRAKLLRSRETVSEELSLHRDDMADEVDLTSSELEAAVRMRLRTREAQFLRKIDEALQRIAEGSFGGCEACGEAIEPRRLEARPITTECLACRERKERRRRVFAELDRVGIAP
jgi:DnaK suppressor protein